MSNDTSSTLTQVSGRLQGTVVRPSALTLPQRQRMFQLLKDYFSNVHMSDFEHDLLEKEWVVVLSDTESDQVQGFSTLMRLTTTVNDETIIAFFSGDTIIDRAYWGETELPRLWGKHVFDLADAEPDARVFWYLISSGYKTYRFLPVFFQQFYPTYKTETPPSIKQILDTLGHLKFPGEYEPDTGIIRFNKAVPLRDGVAEITPQRLKNRHIAFFIEKNPGHSQGDQLACLVELRRDNITAAGKRMLTS
ncbi:MAG: hypothetical protein AAF629_07395 [Chloroflexota bacterium]